MIFLTLLGLMIFYLDIAYGQLCADSPVTSFKFVQLETSYTGCNDSSPGFTKRSRIDCSFFCLNYKNCVAFSFNKTTRMCRVCVVTTKAKLFDTGVTSSSKFYALSQGIKETGTPSDPILFKSIDIPCGLTVGNMVVLKGRFLNENGFRVNLRQDAKNMALHFRPRLDATTNQPTIFLNTLINGAFVLQYRPTYTVYPFTVGAEFELRILARSEDYAFFVDGVFAFNYTYVLNPVNARFIELFDEIGLIEITV